MFSWQRYATIQPYSIWHLSVLNKLCVLQHRNPPPTTKLLRHGPKRTDSTEIKSQHPTPLSVPVCLSITYVCVGMLWKRTRLLNGTFWNRKRKEVVNSRSWWNTACVPHHILNFPLLTPPSLSFWASFSRNIFSLASSSCSMSWIDSTSAVPPKAASIDKGR